MTTPPHLVDDGGEWRLDVSVGSSGRRRLALSDRTEGLLVDDLEYGNRDVVPWVTARAVVLAGGAYRRDGTTDPRELSWSMGGADGSGTASTAELEAVAAYLRGAEIEARAVETLREHVRETGLSAHLAPTDIRDNRRRQAGLRDIAKDL